MKRIIVKTAIFLALAALLSYLLYNGNNYLISNIFKNRIHTDPAGIEGASLAVVPGVGDSVNNLYFKGRVNAAAWLFREGRVHRIITIGLDDGGRYREPQNLRQALIERGVPADAIEADTNGRRTITAVQRIGLRFPHRKVVFVSQRPHLERILFICGVMGVDAVGFASDDSLRYQHPRYHRVRERLARFRCLWECMYWSAFGKLPG